MNKGKEKKKRLFAEPRLPRGIRRGFAEAPLRVRILPGACVNVVCCQVEVSASGRSLVQRNTTERGVSVCDREASIMNSPWTTRGLLRHGGEKSVLQSAY